MKVFFVSLLLVSLQAFAQTSATTSASLEQALIEKSRSLLEAQKTKDVAVLKSALTSDFQMVGSEGKLHNADDLLDDTKDGKLTDYTLYKPVVILVDDNAAIVTFDVIIHMLEGDDGLAPRYQHFSDLWLKQADQWRLKFRQATARRPID